MTKYLILGLTLLLAGCASDGMKSNSKTDDRTKSEVYLQGLTANPITNASDSCNSVKSASWKTMVSKASACARSGQWALVEDYAYQISKSDVDSPWGLYFFSLAAEAKKDYPRAMWMIEAAIKKTSPSVALFRYQKGRLMWEQKPSETALKEIEASAKADPNLLDAHVFLGDARLRSLEYSQAEDQFGYALKLNSNNYGAVRGMADVKRLKGNYRDAIPYFEQAKSLQPSDLSTRVYLASSYEENKQPAQALSTYRALQQSLNSGLIKDKPDFDLNEKIHSLESTIAANETKAQQQTALTRNPAQKGAKK